MSLPSLDLTVVIPAFNNAGYLAESVESVRRQTRPPRRIIVVDDGSTDATPAVAAALREVEGAPVDYIRQDNAGPAAAINRGVALVETSLIALQSSDDIWVPEKTAWQMAAMDGGAELVFGHMQNFISPELDPMIKANLHCPPEPMPGHNTATLFTSTKTFRAIGPFNENFRIGEFFEWYGRAADHGLKIAMLPQVVTMRRLHGANHSLSRKTEAVGYAHVLKAILDRRRGQTGQS